MMNWGGIGTPPPLPTSTAMPPPPPSTTPCLCLAGSTRSSRVNICDTNRRLPTGLCSRENQQHPLSLLLHQLGGGGSSSRRRIRTSATSSSSSSMSTSITMRDRSKNRKPLQRGRNLSIEAIQTIQALKRAAAANTNNHDHDHRRSDSSFLSLERVFDSKLKRLLKSDMMAVLRELLRQNHCLLALNVFQYVQKEYWYKPQVSLYAEIISVLGSNGLYERIDCLFTELKTEAGLQPDTKGFNVLLENLMSFKKTGLAMECFHLMKSLGCEPDKSSFRILVNGLESDTDVDIVRQEAEKYYGKNLEFLEEKDEVAEVKT